MTTYEGIIPYFKYLKREFYVNADPGISLTQFFLRNQPDEIRTTFYSMYKKDFKEITDEEVRIIFEIPNKPNMEMLNL